jgi:hypothetical protein
MIHNNSYEPWKVPNTLVFSKTKSIHLIPKQHQHSPPSQDLHDTMRCRHASFDIPSLQSKLAPPPTPTSRLPAREVSRSAKLASAIISWCMLVYSGVCWFTLSVHGRYSRFRLYLYPAYILYSMHPGK